MDKRYQIFVSSTYADLREERSKVIQALMEMDCIPAGMELFPAADEDQWQFIRVQILWRHAASAVRGAWAPLT